ncbi:MAG: hypothetical protein LBH39_06825 [Clostridiales Family XIII bacterium]|nr:hypothetical protein [Clostridiales Family XIII bacterium]
MNNPTSGTPAPDGTAKPLQERCDNLMKRIDLLITIVDRGKGDKIVQALRDSRVTYNLSSVGYGASGLALVDMLGLTSTEKDIIISVVPEERASEILNILLYKFDLDKPDKGIAFILPISGVSGPIALKYISGLQQARP